MTWELWALVGVAVYMVGGCAFAVRYWFGLAPHDDVQLSMGIEHYVEKGWSLALRCKRCGWTRPA